VAFLGVNSDDSRDDAERFLEENPVPYPSYFDPDVRIARVFRGGVAWPTTAFYDRMGKRVDTHSGPYTSAQDLEEAVRERVL
jgi:hypothetical protein